MLTKGWLPYTLGWEFEVVESRYPHGFTIVASGRLRRPGRLDVRAGRPLRRHATYDWRLRAEKPLLRNLSFLLKPMFEANHRWAMAQGEASLVLELARRRATSDAARAAVPPPPGPVTLRRRGAARRRGGGRRRARVFDRAFAQTMIDLSLHNRNH